MEANGHDEGESHGRKVKDPLGNDEANREENVGSRDEREDHPSNGHHHLPGVGKIDSVEVLLSYYLERGFPDLRIANTKQNIAVIVMKVSRLRGSERDSINGIEPIVQSQQRLEGQKRRLRLT